MKFKLKHDISQDIRATVLSVGFSFLLFSLFVAFSSIAQNKVSGYISNVDTNLPIDYVEVYDKDSGFLTSTDQEGFYQFETDKKNIQLLFFLIITRL